MLEFGYELKAPVMIRYPRGGSGLNELPCSKLEKGHAEVAREGRDLALWAVGREVKTALEAADILKGYGISCRVVNVRFLKPLDSELLRDDARKMPLVTFENTLSGTGLDALSDRLLIAEKHCGILHFTWPAEEQIPHGTEAELRARFGLTAEAAAETIRNRFLTELKNRSENDSR